MQIEELEMDFKKVMKKKQHIKTQTHTISVMPALLQTLYMTNQNELMCAK